MEIPLKKHKLEEAAKDDGRKKKLKREARRRRKKSFSEFNVLNDFVILFLLLGDRFDAEAFYEARRCCLGFGVSGFEI